MKSAASILGLLTLLAGVSHAQIDIPVPNQQVAQSLADAGIVQATLPAAWGQLRNDIKGGNPMQMLARGGDTLWRPDTVQALEVPDGIDPVETLIAVELGGMELTLRLQPQRLQEQDPIVMIELPDGTLERYQPLPSNLYVGNVEGFPESSITASFRNGKLRALIHLSPELAWEIQPLSDVTTGGDPKLHMVWQSSRPMPGPEGRCGVEDGQDHDHGDHDLDGVPPAAGPDQHAGHTDTVTLDQLTDEHIDHSSGGSGEDGGGFADRSAWDSLLAVDVDCYLYDNYNNVQDTLDFVNEVIGASNARYMQRFGFQHLVSYILVRTSCANDPYATPNPDSSNEMLTAMRDNVWNSLNPVPRHQAMLFTGRNLDGAIIGLAYDNSACFAGSGGHLLIEADWNTQSQLRYGVAKHELGHTWGAGHSCDTFGTAGYCSVMCATLDPINCGLTNSDFLPISISQINAYRTTVTCNTHQGTTWYVDATNPYAYPNGNQNHPFLTFMEAYNSAADGETVFVRGHGASYQYVNGFTRLTRPMTIDGNSLNGPARIR